MPPRQAAEASIPTRVTDLFGIRLPVVAGGLQWLSTAEYVAAAARAGIVGFLTAASLEGDDALRREIRRCRDLCEGKPFGVNISMLPKIAPHERVERIVDVVVEEGVRFVETSGRSPETYLPKLKAGGVKVMHKVPAVQFARKAESLGVDAVAVVGYECGGHPGPDAIGSFVLGAVAARNVSIPVILGGGVGTGAHLAAALALDADGVIVGTRFLVASEIACHPDYKRGLIAAGEGDTTLILSSIRNTMRVLVNETSAAVQEIERQGAGTLENLLPLVSGKIGRESYRTGKMDLGALPVGQSVAFADLIEPLADIVARMEREAIASAARLGAIFGSRSEGVTSSPARRARC
jgi:nitronate monooxygenase